MDDLTFIAQKKPRSLSLEDRAKYRVLPDTLTIAQISKLSTNNESDYELLLNVLRSDVVKGELLVIKRSMEEIFEALKTDYIFRIGGGEGKFTLISPDIQHIHRDEFYRYLKSSDQLPQKYYLLINWWPELAQQTEVVGNIGVTEKRDNDFKQWIKTNPSRDLTKAKILTELRKRDSTLWSSEITDWWSESNVRRELWGNGKRGRPKG